MPVQKRVQEARDEVVPGAGRVDRPDRHRRQGETPLFAGRIAALGAAFDDDMADAHGEKDLCGSFR